MNQSRSRSTIHKLAIPIALLAFLLPSVRSESNVPKDRFRIGIERPSGSTVNKMRFSDDGRLLLTMGQEIWSVWEVRTGRKLLSFTEKQLFGSDVLHYFRMIPDYDAEVLYVAYFNGSEVKFAGISLRTEEFVPVKRKFTTKIIDHKGSSNENNSTVIVTHNNGVVTVTRYSSLSREVWNDNTFTVEQNGIWTFDQDDAALKELLQGKSYRLSQRAIANGVAAFSIRHTVLASNHQNSIHNFLTNEEYAIPVPDGFLRGVRQFSPVDPVIAVGNERKLVLYNWMSKELVTVTTDDDRMITENYSAYNSLGNISLKDGFAVHCQKGMIHVADLNKLSMAGSVHLKENMPKSTYPLIIDPVYVRVLSKDHSLLVIKYRTGAVSSVTEVVKVSHSPVRIVQRIPLKIPNYFTYFHESSDGNLLVTETQGNIQIVDVARMKVVAATKGRVVSSPSSVNDEFYFIQDNRIGRIDGGGKVHPEVKIPLPADEKIDIEQIVFSHDKKKAIVTYQMSKYLVIDIEANRWQRSSTFYRLTNSTISFNAASDTIWTSTNGNVSFIPVTTGILQESKMPFTIGADAQWIETEKGRYILTSSGNEFAVVPFVFAPGSRVKPAAVFSGKGGIGLSPYTDDGTIVWVGMFGELNLYDIRKDRSVSMFFGDAGDKILMMTGDRYYAGDPELLRGYYFVGGFRTYGIEQFDLQYNRPDIVYEVLSGRDRSFKELLDIVVTKRKNRIGSISYTDQSNISVSPQIEVRWKDVRTTPLGDVLPVSITSVAAAPAVARINVFADGVPVFGQRGISFERQHQVSAMELEIPLLRGLNTIEISATSTEGIESVRQEYKVQSKGSTRTPKVLSLHIGVSEFADAEFNLTYAAKDAKDLASSLFRSGAGVDLEPTVLLNEQATRDAILALKEKFLRTHPEDMVVVTIASHGLIDEDQNFILATHDIDFNHPKEKGLPYAALEELLDGIPARRKVLMIDACNSGEAMDADSSSVSLSTIKSDAGKKSDVTVKTRGFKKSGQPFKHSVSEIQMLMERLFPDVRRGTGAIVISASGAREFALESSQWKNGVFTYSILNGMKNGSADGNSNGKVSIRELKEYVYKEVPRLTNGQQNPTTRMDNFRMDFIMR